MSKNDNVWMISMVGSPTDYSWEGTRVNWDLDGVIAPLFEQTLQIYNAKYDDTLKPSDAKSYWISDLPLKCSADEMHDLMANIDYADMTPYPGMVEIARDIADMGFISAVVSSLMWFHPTNTHAVEKRQWVHKYLGKDFATVFTGDKHWCCRHKDDILIDDKPDNIKHWPGRGVLLERPWNRIGREDWMDICPPERLHEHLMALLGVNLF